MFYVYILKNPISRLPFYVGVGKYNRRSNTSRECSHIVEAMNYRNGKIGKHANRHKLNTILKILDSGYEVEIELFNDRELFDEISAFSKEVELIQKYGRRDLATGTLTNMTDGGEGRVNPSIASRQAQSVRQTGLPSPLRGRIVGPYSEERKMQHSAKIKSRRADLSAEEVQDHHENRSAAQRGKTPWNKGLTKDDPRVAKYVTAKIGIPRPDMVGKTPWNKGKECPEIGLSKKGKPALNKGKPSGKKGMTYAEIYGPEKAAEMLEKRRLQKIKFWEEKRRNE